MLVDAASKRTGEDGRVSVTPDTTGLHLFVQSFGQRVENAEEPVISRPKRRFRENRESRCF